ncbi:hypothetical protein KXX08_006488 [Aspergillus fumigatus]|nr:hypothetical protein KXX08_006488 [Aspergillus fumigatus]
MAAGTRAPPPPGDEGQSRRRRLVTKGSDQLAGAHGRTGGARSAGAGGPPPGTTFGPDGPGEARALEASRESRARGRRREGEEGEEGEEEEEGEARRRARGGQLAGRVGAAGGAARAGGRVTSWREPLGQAGRRQARARAMDRRWPSDTLAGTGGDQLAGARQGPTPGRETPRRTREAPEVTSWPARARPCRHRRAARRLRGHLQRQMPAWPAGGIHPWGYADTHPSIHIYMCICTRIPPRHLHGDPAADIGRARAPCRSERWAARAEGTGGQAGAGFEGRPALRARDGASDQVPLRPKQRANLRGPLCMGARANARTTPYRMGPPPARSGPGNVCTHDHGPVEVGGSMWKARAASPLVACELCAGHFFPARQAASL